MNARFAAERENHNKLYYMEYENDACLPHFHSQIELYFVDDGSMDIVVNNHKRTLSDGSLAVSLSFDTHQYQTNNYSRSSVFIIPAQLSEKIKETVSGKHVSDPFITDRETISLIKSCIAQVNSGKLSEIQLLGYIYVILGTVIENIGFEKISEPVDNDLISKILFYINEHFTEQISLNSIADALGYSSFYISKFFKNSLKIGFNQYVTMLRLRNAVALMSEHKHSITYCAMESGFTSMRTFYRTFLNEYGETPKEYLKNL